MLRIFLAGYPQRSLSKMNEMKTFRIAASIVVCNPEGKILIIREGDSRAYDKVNLPGGHIEDDESIIECAIREVHEETGQVQKAHHLQEPLPIEHRPFPLHCSLLMS